MNPSQAKKDLIAQIFMPAWFTRWLVFSAFSIMWWNYPRTMYSIFFVIDLAFIGLAFASMKGIWSPLALLFGIEEVLIALWHMFQLILFADFYKGGEGVGKMSDSGVKFLTWVIVLFVIFCILIELAILILGLLAKEGDGEADNKEADDGSSDLQFEVAASGTELNNKIATYQTMKRNANDGASNNGRGNVRQTNQA